jgi:hypothetical protein
MFLEIGSVLCKNGSGRPTKRTAENIEEVKFGTVQFILKKDLHFFLYRMSVVHEIKPLNNKSPHNITSLKRRPHR